MERRPEGTDPDSDAIRARLRQRMVEHRRELLARGLVLGLDHPRLADGFVSASNNTSVTLLYGELLAQQGPLLSVCTSRVRHPGLAESAEGHLADEHQRLLDHAQLTDSDPGLLETSSGVLVVQGEEVEFDFVRDRYLWAAQTERPDPQKDAERLIVTVVSRGVPMDEVRLQVIPDLEPFLDRREQALAWLADRLPSVRPEDLDLPPTRGLSAHRALVEYMITQAEARESAVRARRRTVPSSARERQRLWEAAVRAQMHLADQQRSDANSTVTSLVNQLTTMSSTLDWFDQPELRAAAIEETIGFAVFGAPVPSSPAQQAWARWWQDRRSFASTHFAITDRPPGPLPADAAETLRSRADHHRDLRRDWIAAWIQWQQNTRT